MRRLAQHLDAARRSDPNDRRLVVFCLDEALVDPARPGLIEVIRWLQLQPSTFVAMVSDRPPHHRREVLCALDRLGQPMRVRFDPDLVRVGHESPASAVDGFRRDGYRVVAVVGRDPTMIGALARADDTGDLLLFHARGPADPPVAAPQVIEGEHFDLTTLVGMDDLPSEVSLVWHGVNDVDNLQQFLASPVEWGECDVRRDPRGRLVLRHDSFATAPWTSREQLLPLADVVAALVDADRAVKLDLKDGPDVLAEVTALLDEHGYPQDRLWFNASIDVLGVDGFRRLRWIYPRAILQCPVDFLTPLLLAMPTQARDILSSLSDWGVDRLSLAWGADHLVPLLDRLQGWGHAVNIYGVPGLAPFLRAALLLPHSLTADFNFPQWGYHGRGSGEGCLYPTPAESGAAA